MKITKSNLKQIIKEEILNLLEVDMEFPEFRLQDADFYYKETVEKIVEDILKILPATGKKTKHKKTFFYSWDYPVDVEVWSDNYEDAIPAFEVEVIFTPTNFDSSHVGWNIDGASDYYGDGGKIIVDFTIRPGLFLSGSNIASIENELFNVVAHELHHFTQDGRPFQRPNCTYLPTKEYNSMYEYFTSACETPAFLIGFRAEASKSQKSIEELIQNYLHNQVQSGIVTSDEAEDIKNRWLNHSVWDR